MPNSYDWRADVRARLADARLDPADEAEIVEEVGQHLEQQFAELAPRIGSDAARAQLLAQLRDEGFAAAAAGKRRHAKPSRARVWSSSSLVRDLRYGFRSLRRSPGTLIAGSAALALGIGLTATMFSIIYGLLLKGLPFDDPSRIAVVKYIDPRRPGVDALVALGDYAQYRATQRTFELFAAYTPSTANISGGDRADRVTAARVTPGVLEASRVRPALGRTFSSSDAASDAPLTVVLSHAVWRDRFASNPAAIGQTMRVDGQPHTIIGVMPSGFAFPQDTRLWLPLRANFATVAPGQGPMVTIIGRLRASDSYAVANAEFKGLAKEFAATRTAADSTMRIVVLPFVRASVNPRFYNIMGVMLTAVFLVLLIACANVANLLLDRAVNRAREIGIRTALGASRLAVVRQSLVESGVLAAIAGVLGIGVAMIGIMLFNRAVAQLATPLFWMDVRLHPPVLAFAIAVAFAASIVSGVLPALHTARFDINAILKDESQAASSFRAGRLSRTIVVAEIALSSALLLVSGFITRTLVNLRDLDPGFTTAGIVTARVTLSTADSVRQRAFFESLARELAALPGGAATYLGTGLPGVGWVPHRLSMEGAKYATDRDRPVVRTLAVTPGFFQTFGVRVVRGRAIDASDRAGAPGTAVVSESFARRFVKNGAAIGKRIRVGSDSTAWLTIVGVMPSLFATNLEDPWGSEVVTSFWQEPRAASASVALGSGDASTAATLRRIVASIDPDVPVYATQSMNDAMAEERTFAQLFGTIFLVFGVAALALSSIGLYAVMSFSVARRVREIGIRLALGAAPRDVMRLIARQGAWQTLLGMVVGFAVGALLVRAIGALLFGVRPGDPFVTALVAAVLAGTATLACMIPARRATRVDPVIALRAD